MTMRFGIVAALLALGLGCASDPLPEDRYYRLSQQPAVRASTVPIIDGFLQIDPIRAPGVLNERQVLYSKVPSRAQLEQYNYHVWVDPPPKLVRQFLIESLRRANVAKVTADRLPVGPDRYRLSGNLLHFERVVRSGTWHASVAMEVRLDSATADATPKLLKVYESEIAASDDAVAGSAVAFSEALNDIARRLVDDMQAMDD